MIISVWTGEVKSDAVDEANQVIQKFAELLRNTKGLKKFASGIDPTNSKVVVVALWESEEAANDKRAAPEFKETMANLLPLFSKPLERQSFEGWTEL